MGYVAEVMDGWTWQQLRDEVSRLSQGHARATNQAERDREALRDIAREVLRGNDKAYARAFCAPKRAVSGGTLSAYLGAATVRRLLEIIDAAETEERQEGQIDG